LIKIIFNSHNFLQFLLQAFDLWHYTLSLSHHMSLLFFFILFWRTVNNC
jgi:hypothetical protein